MRVPSDTFLFSPSTQTDHTSVTSCNINWSTAAFLCWGGWGTSANPGSLFSKLCGTAFCSRQSVSLAKGRSVVHCLLSAPVKQPEFLLPHHSGLVCIMSTASRVRTRVPVLLPIQHPMPCCCILLLLALTPIVSGKSMQALLARYKLTHTTSCPRLHTRR